MTEPTTAMYQGAPRPGGPVWTVAAVAHRLGIVPSTLRTWSHRYGMGPAGHHPGQRRRYTDDDVTELDTLRRLVGRGIILAAAADMAREKRYAARPATATLGRAGGVVIPRRAVAHLVAAARRLDDTEATAIITRALARHGVVTTWDTLWRPALTDAALDAGPSATAGSDPDGGGSADAILLLPWAVTTSLRRLSARPGPRTSTGVGPLLLACAREEHHTLALEAMHAALIERGVQARMLGPSIPEFALLSAAAALQSAVTPSSASERYGPPPGPRVCRVQAATHARSRRPTWAQLLPGAGDLRRLPDRPAHGVADLAVRSVPSVATCGIRPSAAC